MTILHYPFAVLLSSLLLLWLSVQAGAFFIRRKPLNQDQRDDLTVITNAALTLLALIIGFSFSMAVTRYDQRKNYEEEEANAIGTEYVRVDLIPAEQADKLRELLRTYLDERVRFYESRDPHQLQEDDRKTAEIQADMWSIVQLEVKKQPTPPMALVMSGMNDVLNRQGYTQAAWRNRIPEGAWVLMVALGVCCGILVGFGSHHRGPFLFTILPFVVAVAFFLISDIDSPRFGMIRVLPQNLIRLSESMHH